MPIRASSAQPGEQRTLAFWQIIETARGARHCVGWRVETGHAHLSPALVAFDPAALRGTSVTGQHHQLRGEPGLNMDAAATPGQWCEASGADVRMVPRADLVIPARRDS
ncbi:hypothetical protein [Paraburkholderia sp. SIMBA_030]|uniref:hypothetical protein n=1 Tax=Paraburkholderia sp. SIMBA_030 TaxID=3085773 RepID=UPI0039788A28